jgi:uncharacterized membrane protein YGL010W
MCCFTYFFIEEVEVSSAFILGLVGLVGLFLLIDVPVGLVIIPLVFLTVIIGRLQVEVIAESLVAVCDLSVSTP